MRLFCGFRSLRLLRCCRLILCRCLLRRSFVLLRSSCRVRVVNGVAFLLSSSQLVLRSWLGTSFAFMYKPGRADHSIIFIATTFDETFLNSILLVEVDCRTDTFRKCLSTTARVSYDKILEVIVNALRSRRTNNGSCHQHSKKRGPHVGT